MNCAALTLIVPLLRLKRLLIAQICKISCLKITVYKRMVCKEDDLYHACSDVVQLQINNTVSPAKRTHRSVKWEDDTEW